ncbi:MAG: hypothetical protein ACE5R6_09695 [Candidatus Heimdallarchaeota archaeon]
MSSVDTSHEEIRGILGSSHQNLQEMCRHPVNGPSGVNDPHVQSPNHNAVGLYSILFALQQPILHHYFLASTPRTAARDPAQLFESPLRG